jgi:ADP-heptose:LPS heptosyltransferase
MLKEGIQMRYNSERGSGLLKFMDRSIGIPLVYFLGLMKRKYRGLPTQVGRVAFMKTAAIGDTVLLSAIIKDFKDSHPRAHLTLYTGSSNHEIATMLPGVDAVVRLPMKDPIKSINIIKRAGYYDLWFDFDSWPRINAVLSFFSDAGTRVGFKTDGQYRHYTCNLSVLHSDSVHEIENYRSLLQAAINLSGNNLPSLKLNGVKVRANRITVHAFPGGSRSYMKEWPEDRWVSLVNFLTRQGYEVYLTGAFNDEPRAQRIKSHAERNPLINIVAGKLDIKRTANLLKSSRLVISVDTGIMHMASALGCNLVALHGPTSPKRWGPLNNNSVTVKSAQSCSPCLNLGFDFKCADAKCMSEISVQEVLEATRTFISI